MKEETMTFLRKYHHHTRCLVRSTQPCSRKNSWELFRRQELQVKIIIWKLRHAWEHTEEQKREKGEEPLLVGLKIRHNMACLEEGENAESHSVDFLLRKINLFEGNTRYLDICHPKRKWRQSYLEIKSHCLSSLFKTCAQDYGNCDVQVPLWRANWFFWPYTYK